MLVHVTRVSLRPVDSGQCNGGGRRGQPLFTMFDITKDYIFDWGLEFIKKLCLRERKGELTWALPADRFSSR